MTGQPTTPIPSVRVLWRPEQFNFVTNGTFETNTSGWATTAGINAAGTSITRVTTDFHSGTASASVVCTSTDTSGVNFDMGTTRFYSEASYGSMYAAVVWLKRVSGSRRARITLGSLGTTADRATLTITDLSDAWQPYVVRWLPTGTRTDVELAVTNGSAEALTFRVDDVAVYLVDAFSQVENGTFEVDTTGWSAYLSGSIARSTAESFGGSACARITSGATAFGGATYTLSGRSFVSGRTYRVRVAVKTISGSGQWYLELSDGTTTTDTFFTPDSTFTWQTADVTCAANRTTMDVWIGHVAASSAVLAVDEVEVYEAVDDLGTDAGDMTWSRVDGVGPITVRVDNHTNKYDPRNSSATLYGALEPGKRIWGRATYGGALYPLFYGTLTTIECDPYTGSADFVAEDVVADFQRGRFASSFIENSTYYTIRGRVLAAVLNRDPWLEDSTTGASRRHRYLHGPEGNNFYVGTDGVVNALDVLNDMNEATGSIHYMDPSVHANIGWYYTSKARTQFTANSTDLTVNEDFEALLGVRLTHEALENNQLVPWQGYEMWPMPPDDTNGNGAGTVAQAITLGASYGDWQLDQDPYLHYTRDEYGDNGDVPEPTFRIIKRWRKRPKGRRLVKKHRRVYEDAYVPFTIKAGEVRRVTFDFALPVSGPILSIQGPAGTTTITTTEVEKSPTRYVLDLSASADTVIDYVIVTGTPWTPLDEEEAEVVTGSDENFGAYAGPGFSTPFIPAKGDAEGLGAYRNWRYSEPRLRPQLVLGVGQIASVLSANVTQQVSLTATRWNISGITFLVTGVRWDVSAGGLEWHATLDLEELPPHSDWFVWDTSLWDDSTVWAY